MAGTTSVVLNPGVGGASIGVDSDGTSSYEIVKLGVGASGTTPTQVSGANPLPTAQFDNYAIVDHADVPVASGGTDNSIIANPNRKAVTVYNLAASGSIVRLRGSGNTVGGVEIQPGMSFTIRTQAALAVYNPGNLSATYGWQEYV